MTYGTVNATDLYRSGLVQSVAALDAYVHGVLLDYGIEIIAGTRVGGKAVGAGLSLGAVSDLISVTSSVELELRARVHLAERLSKETFQRPDAISQGFSAIGIKKIWSLAFPENASSMVTSLGIIVARRNQIVHGCDVDPLEPGTVVPLADRDAISAVDTINQIVCSIDTVI